MPKFKSPLVTGVADINPRLGANSREVERKIVDLQKRVGELSIASGVLTSQYTLPGAAASLSVAHSLRKVPSGFFVAYYVGDYPAFSVTSMNARTIEIVSAIGTAPVFKLWVF